MHLARSFNTLLIEHDDFVTIVLSMVMGNGTHLGGRSHA